MKSQPRDIKNKNNIKILPSNHTFIYVKIKDSDTEDGGRKSESFSLTIDYLGKHWSKGNALDLYSECARFKTRPRHTISILRFFVIFSSPSWKIPL
jgi:hypothetical protein